MLALPNVLPVTPFPLTLKSTIISLNNMVVDASCKLSETESVPVKLADMVLIVLSTPFKAVVARMISVGVDVATRLSVIASNAFNRGEAEP